VTHNCPLKKKRPLLTQVGRKNVLAKMAGLPFWTGVTGNKVPKGMDALSPNAYMDSTVLSKIFQLFLLKKG
jgi:hypothetical protein